MYNLQGALPFYLFYTVVNKKKEIFYNFEMLRGEKARYTVSKKCAKNDKSRNQINSMSGTGMKWKKKEPK